VTWSVNDATLATVDTNGIVTANNDGKAGGAIVTVTTVNGNYTANCTVTIEPVHVTGVRLDMDEIPLAEGTSDTLTAIVEPANATNKNVTWVSSAPNIASVSANGLVTGESSGDAVITVHTEDGDFQASCKVTVSTEGREPRIPPEIVDPEYPSDKEDVSNKTGIHYDNLDAINGKVYLSRTLAEKIAKGLLKVDAVDTYILPIFEGTTQPNSDIVGLKFTVKGKDLLALYPEDVNLIGMISGSAGKLLDYVDNLMDFDDGKFTILFKGVVFDGMFDPNEDYELVVFIKDFGTFDLDRILNGKVIASLYLAAEKTTDGGRKGRGGGCNADYGLFAIALLVIPFAFSRKR
jgi:Synergist-CTERM protein sorting domain-containing protein